jgi:hypothetical protein
MKWHTCLRQIPCFFLYLHIWLCLLIWSYLWIKSDHERLLSHVMMDKNHGGGILLLNHKKEPFTSVAKKKKDLFMGGRERGRNCLFPYNDKLQNPLRSLMIKYRILYDPWWDSFIDTDPDLFLVTGTEGTSQMDTQIKGTG